MSMGSRRLRRIISKHLEIIEVSVTISKHLEITEVSVTISKHLEITEVSVISR